MEVGGIRKNTTASQQESGKARGLVGKGQVGATRESAKGM